MSKGLSEQIKLMLVDDDENTRRVYAEILSEDGYSVEAVADLASAMQALKSSEYELILTDLRLPDGSGLDLLDTVKTSGRDAEVIIVTGYASVENTIKALNEGAFAYLQKPVNMDELRIFLSRAIKSKRMAAENKALLTRFKELSLKDSQTGLYNCRYLNERLNKELERARRHSLPLSMAMVDIDYFKSINDVYGHSYGDRILQDFSEFLKDFVRSSDVVVRYGGEEFVIILTDTDRAGAVTMVRRLLENVNRHVFDPHGKRVKLTVSVGVWSLPKDGLSATSSSALDAVDSSMLKAKESGGDMLFMYPDVAPAAPEAGLEESCLEDFRDKISHMQKRANQSVVESIYALAKTIEAKHSSISEHAEDMVAIVGLIARRMGIAGKNVEKIKQAALLHDLGKIGIPDKILGKKGPLTPEEYEIVRRHPQIGAEIVRSIHSLNGVSQMILYHHERYNGLGYPHGLKGKQIPIPSSNIAIVDVYQALISDRPYHAAYSQEEALEIIKQGSGTDFDPEVVRVFLEVIEENESDKKKEQGGNDG